MVWCGVVFHVLWACGRWCFVVACGSRGGDRLHFVSEGLVVRRRLCGGGGGVRCI